MSASFCHGLGMVFSNLVLPLKKPPTIPSPYLQLEAQKAMLTGRDKKTNNNRNNINNRSLQNCRCIAMFSEVLQTSILDVNQSCYMIRTKYCPACAVLLLSLEPVIFGQNLSLMLLGASKQLHQIRQTFQPPYNLC